MTKTNLAVVGCGAVGKLHGHASLLIRDRVTLVAGVDPVQAMRDEFAQLFGVPTFATVAEMLSKVKVDAASLGTPQQYRLAPSLALADAGVHLLMEKPFTASPRDGRLILEKARERNVKVSGVSQRAFYEPMVRTKAAIADGTIVPTGGIIQILGHRDRAYFEKAAFRGKRGDGGTFNQWQHYLANSIHLFGEIVAVSGELANHTHPYIQAEDWSSALIRFASGATLTFVGTNSVAAGSSHSGTIRLFDKNEGDILLQLDKEMFVAGGAPPSTGPSTQVWNANGAVDGTLTDWQAREQEVFKAAGRADAHYHSLQILDFVNALQTGSPLMVPGETLLMAADATAAIHLSALTGVRVKMPLSQFAIDLFQRWLDGGSISEDDAEELMQSQRTTVAAAV